MPDRMLFDGNAKLEMLGRGAQYPGCGTRDLGSDSVTGQNNHAHVWTSLGLRVVGDGTQPDRGKLVPR
jgi:hypothetical protein